MNKNEMARIFIASIKCDDMPMDQCYMKCDVCPLDVPDETFYQAQKEVVTWLTLQEVVTKDIEVPDSAVIKNFVALDVELKLFIILLYKDLGRHVVLIADRL